MAKEDADPRAQLLELVREFKTAMLVTHRLDGPLRARPLSLAQEHDDGVLYFATAVDSPKVDEVVVAPDVLVTLQDSSRYVSISGKARVTRDRALIERLWSEPWRVWFPDGKDDPKLCILAVIPEEAEYWDQSGTKGLRYLAQMIKAYATGTTPSSGVSSDNQKLRL
jgi:general stress protein 26